MEIKGTSAPPARATLSICALADLSLMLGSQGPPPQPQPQPQGITPHSPACDCHPPKTPELQCRTPVVPRTWFIYALLQQRFARREPGGLGCLQLGVGHGVSGGV